MVLTSTHNLCFWAEVRKNNVYPCKPQFIIGLIVQYSWLSLSRPRLSRITAYLEVKIWSLPKHENLTTCKKYCGKEEKLLLFQNIFNISLVSRVQLHIYLINVVNRFIFSSILQIYYVEVRISRSISESPLEFEITRVDCIWKWNCAYVYARGRKQCCKPHYCLCRVSMKPRLPFSYP